MYDFLGRTGIEKLTQLIKGKLADVATSGSYSDLSDKPTISNPNLLINPDFKINQRVVSGTKTPNKNPDGEDIHTYFVDRWGIDSGSVTINADGTLTLNGTMSQILENAVGTNVTASVSAGMASYDDSTKTFTITGNGVTISWAKLETGSTPTPFSPPDTATELMKCKRYYQRISGAYRHIANGYIQAANVAGSIIPLPQELRKTSPTINFVGKIYLWYKGHIGSGGVTSTQTASPPNVSQITLSMSFKLDTDVDASYIGLPCFAQFRDATSYIEIDAEL